MELTTKEGIEGLEALQRALESVALAAGEHLVFEDRSDTRPEWL